jgi:urease accessory protein
MVGGDEIELDVQVNNNAIAVLGTQASTKIYKDQTGRGCKQLIRARVADQAILVAVPDPVTCYRDAAFDQTQSIYLAGDASLVLVDWVTSGRRDAGEIWDFSQYRSSIQIYRDEQLQLLDTILLDSNDGALTAEYRLGRFHCLATVVLAGPKMVEFSETIIAELKKEEPTQRGQLIESMSPFDDGFVLRILGETTEMTSNRLKLRLGFLKTLLDETPWDRKW